MHAKVYREARKALIKRSPYSVYYRSRADRVVILAILHNKRNPDTWKSRA